MSDLLLEARGITRRFHENGVLAVDRADLSVAVGEIHAVIGENGAGKSTLMQVIAGTVAPDAGTVTLGGVALPPGDVRAARDAGVCMSYQHPRLDRGLTVLENLFLGEEPRRLGFLFDRRAARERVHATAPDFEAGFLDRRLGSLSSGQVRMVSLIGALLRLPTDRRGLLILDEPTEATTPDEVERIFTIMRRAAGRSHGVLFISHRLPEVERVAHTVTVMRSGRVVARLRAPVATTDLAHAMLGVKGKPTQGDPADGPAPSPLPGEPAGRGVPTPTAGPSAASAPPEDTTPTRPGVPALRLSALVVRRGDRLLLDTVDLEVATGEIVGITGIRENGLEALEELLAGRHAVSEGGFEVLGVDARGRSSAALRAIGMRYVPTDRLLRGASLESSVSDNLIALKRRQLRRGGLLAGDRIERFAGSLRAGFGIEGGLSVPLRQLSGGNIQKVILSRELEGSPRLVVVCEPSWGLDIVSRSAMVDRIRSAATTGAAVLVISTSVDEVLELSSRILVLYDGRVVASFDRATATRIELGRAMAGAAATGAAT